jgi:hypothetical protein
MRGYVTLASSHLGYLEMAVDLALSLREYNGEPIALVLGEELRAQAAPAQFAAFDRMVPLDPAYPRNIGKAYTARAGLFDAAISIDADCLVTGSLRGLWERMGRAPFAVQGEFIGPDDDREHHRRSTAALMRRFGLARYLRCNAGYMYFRREPGIAIAEACHALYREAFAGQIESFEILLGIVSSRFPIATIQGPIPMAFAPKLVLPADRRFPIVHVFGPLRRDTMAYLMDGVRRRRRAAGLPETASLPYWRRKSTWLSRRALRGALATAAVEQFIRWRRRVGTQRPVLG